ncbi:MAG: HEAT repeat domain-containing protein [Dehalococcoidales bacterium]|nr:HEAT repeat domain-containing protein [Dehalococcoidales bacterium]
MITSLNESSTQAEKDTLFSPELYSAGYLSFPLFSGVQGAGQPYPSIELNLIGATSSISNQDFSAVRNYIINNQAIIFSGITYQLSALEKPSTPIETSDYDSGAVQIEDIDNQTKQEITKLYYSYQQEMLDTESSEEFSEQLELFIQMNGTIATFLVSYYLQNSDINDDLKCETLKAIGRTEDEVTSPERYKLLLQHLKDSSVTVRDGAICGLSYFNDPRAIPQLRFLYFNESSPILKNNIKVAIESLTIETSSDSVKD